MFILEDMQGNPIFCLLDAIDQLGQSLGCVVVLTAGSLECIAINSLLRQAPGYPNGTVSEELWDSATGAFLL